MYSPTRKSICPESPAASSPHAAKPMVAAFDAEPRASGTPPPAAPGPAPTPTSDAPPPEPLEPLEPSSEVVSRLLTRYEQYLLSAEESEVVHAAVILLEHMAGVATRIAGVTVDPTSGKPTPAVDPSDVTAYHSFYVPPVSLERYAARLAQYSGYGAIGILSGMVLLLRQIRATRTLPTLLTVHRLLLACVTVSVKTNSDHFLKNSVMARIGGVSPIEINTLEQQLVVDLQYSCHITGGEMRHILQWAPSLLHQAPAATQPTTTPATLNDNRVAISAERWVQQCADVLTATARPLEAFASLEGHDVLAAFRVCATHQATTSSNSNSEVAPHTTPSQTR